jgi:PAS domain S-box-containing protein
LKVFEAYKGMYECEYLPAFAEFLLKNHLHDYAIFQLSLGRKLKIPLMTGLSLRYSDEQIIAIAEESAREYLTYLAGNKAYEQLNVSMNKWFRNQLEVVGKDDIVAEDISLIGYLRSRSLKKFITDYTKDLKTIHAIDEEIDRVLLGVNTTGYNIYIDILKDKIREQSKLATKVIETSPAMTFVFDVALRKLAFVSHNVSTVMGYSSEELLELKDYSLVKLIYPEDLEKVLSHIQALLNENSNDTHQLEYRFKQKDGQYRWFRNYEVIFSRDEKGHPVEILGKTFEITSEKETAMALEEREHQLLEAQSIAQIGSYEWFIDENISVNTTEVFRIFEMDTNQKYEEFISYVHPDDLQKVKNAITESFITGHYESEYRYVKNGKEKVIWSLGKVEFRNGKPYKVSGTVQDVTVIKKMERELLLKSEQLERSNESLRQFAYVASHDMKEPLRKIMMFSDMVISTEKDRLSEKSVTQLKKMQLASRSLYRMIEDILSFSLLEAKEEKQHVNLGEVINQVTEILDESIKEKKASIVYNGLPEVMVIGSQFRQLFQNLIANSLKFTRGDAPRIEIHASLTPSPSIQAPVEANQYLEIKVKDNGIGFPAEVSEKIFELFNRLHPKTKYEGTGLGLSISRRIVENHQGVIKASGKVGEGAVFTIVVPQEQLN